MTVSAETYIVISLMFAVFAAVAAVGTSVVLGAGFERLRAGFEIVRKQSGFFADAIYKLDLRTQKIGEDTERLKAGLGGLGNRMERAEQTASFLADSISSIEHRILEGSPAQAPVHVPQSKPRTVYTMARKPSVNVMQAEWERVPTTGFAPVNDPAPENKPLGEPGPFETGYVAEKTDNGEGFTTLLSRYFVGEASGNGHQIVYH